MPSSPPECCAIGRARAIPPGPEDPGHLLDLLALFLLEIPLEKVITVVRKLFKFSLNMQQQVSKTILEKGMQGMHGMEMNEIHFLLCRNSECVLELYFIVLKCRIPTTLFIRLFMVIFIIVPCLFRK